jgi:hypothetical protein
MDLSSTFKSEVYRPIVTVLIPGATALAPYLFILNHKYSGISAFAEKYTAISSVIILLLSIVAGFILENIGARIESNLWDNMQSDNNTHKEEWYKYLRTAFLHEPVGQRYLRTVTLRMKFELSFGVSIIPVCLGFLWLYNIGLIDCSVLIYSGLSLAALFFYLMCESYSSSKVLSSLRKELLSGVIINPNPSSNA